MLFAGRPIKNVFEAVQTWQKGGTESVFKRQERISVVVLGQNLDEHCIVIRDGKINKVHIIHTYTMRVCVLYHGLGASNTGSNKNNLKV